LKNPEKFTYIEDEEITKVRLEKIEEWKKKEEIVVQKQKNEQEFQVKMVEQVKKQREYERKFVTSDSNGNVIMIKLPHILPNEFLMPKAIIKEEVKENEKELPEAKNKKKKKKEKEDSINSNNIFDAGKRKEGKKRTSTIKAKGLINQLKNTRR